MLQPIPIREALGKIVGVKVEVARRDAVEAVDFGKHLTARVAPNALHLHAAARGRPPAEPPTLPSAVPNWSPGDTIPPGGSRMLRVIEIRPTPEPDGDPVLVMEAA